MTLDKSEARRRRWKKTGNSYEKEIDLPLAPSIGGEKQEHPGNGLVRLIRAKRTGRDLAICRRAGNANRPGELAGDRGGRSLIKKRAI